MKNHAKDTINCWLIYANQTEDDILLRKELESLVADDRIQFRVHYTLDRPPTDGSWKHSTGFVNVEMCRDHLPKATDPNTMVFLCGPPPMIKFACGPALKELDFAEEQTFTF